MSLQNVYSFGREIVCILEQTRIKYGMSIAELARRTDTDKKRLWYVLNRQRDMRLGVIGQNVLMANPIRRAMGEHA